MGDKHHRPLSSQTANIILAVYAGLFFVFAVIAAL